MAKGDYRTKVSAVYRGAIVGYEQLGEASRPPAACLLLSSYLQLLKCASENFVTRRT